MGQYAIPYYFLVIAAAFGAASLPLFRAADAPPSPASHRLPTLDGLRGLLALSVVIHHGAVYISYLRDGAWTVPPSRFYTMAGEGGVALFFMVTGYLFWSRLIVQRGRPGWLRFYVGRVFRIGPVYLVAVAGVLAYVLPATGWTLQVTGLQALKQALRWASLGAVNLPDLNGYPQTWVLLAGVTWSLRYEWLFYAALPLLAVAARHSRTHLPFAAGGLALYAAWGSLTPLPREAAYAGLFLAGMTAASLHQAGWGLPGGDRLASWAAAGLLAAGSAGFWTAYAPGPVLVLGGAFYLVASGCSLFGLLLTRPARRLGDVSYGIYLLQGLVLAAVLPHLPAWARADALPLAYWLVVAVCAVLIVMLATLVHVLVERPGIRLGQRVAAALSGPQGSARPANAVRP